MLLFLNMLNGMANIVDPDQTGPFCFACAILSETLVYKILGHLPYIHGGNKETKLLSYHVFILDPGCMSDKGSRIQLMTVQHFIAQSFSSSLSSFWAQLFKASLA